MQSQLKLFLVFFRNLQTNLTSSTHMLFRKDLPQHLGINYDTGHQITVMLLKASPKDI